MVIEGALFDFDGVLFDTERDHEICWRKVAAHLGKSITREQFLEGFGVKNALFIRTILQWSDDDNIIQEISKMKERAFEEHCRTTVIHPIRGSIELLFRLYNEQIPCVIASSSIRKNIDSILSFYPELQGVFQGIVSAENIVRGKPEPDVFLAGAKILKARPENIVVFEDAPLGIRAARSANMIAVGLTTTFSKERLTLEKPHLITSDLSNLSIKELEQL